MKILKNKKVVLASAIILGISAITSSALAAYIITGGTKENSAEVKPSEVVVNNNVVDLTATIDVSDTLLFQPETPYTGSGALHSEGNGDLTVTLKLSVEASRAEALGVTTVTFSEKKRADVEYEGVLAEAGDYVAFPSVGPIASSSFKDENSDGTWEYSVNLKFGWGTVFGEKDPCTYYETAGKSTNVIATTMNAFAAAVNATTFEVNVSMADPVSA